MGGGRAGARRGELRAGRKEAEGRWEHTLRECNERNDLKRCRRRLNPRLREDLTEVARVRRVVAAALSIGRRFGSDRDRSVDHQCGCLCCEAQRQKKHQVASRGGAHPRKTAPARCSRQYANLHGAGSNDSVGITTDEGRDPVPHRRMRPGRSSTRNQWRTALSRRCEPTPPRHPDVGALVVVEARLHEE